MLKGRKTLVDAAHDLGCTTDDIRNRLRNGTFPEPAERDLRAGGTRLFSDAEIETMRGILHGQEERHAARCR